MIEDGAMVMITVVHRNRMNYVTTDAAYVNLTPDDVALVLKHRHTLVNWMRNLAEGDLIDLKLHAAPV